MVWIEELDKHKPKRGLDPKAKLSVRLSNPRYLKDTESDGPQTIIKTASHSRGVRARNVMEYISRAGKEEGAQLEFETDTGESGKGRANVQALYQEWAQDFERKKPGAKRTPRHVTHLVLSAQVENTEKDAKRMLAATRDFLQANFGQHGYRYMMVMHRDTEYPHVHVVMSSYNRDREKPKLHWNAAKFLDLRREYTDRLHDYGFRRQVATLRRDRQEVVQKMQQGMDRLRTQTSYFMEKVKQAGRRDQGFDAIARRSNLAAQAVRMKKQIERATLPLTASRKEAKKVLRDLTQAVMTATEKDLQKQTQATVKYFTHEAKWAGGQANRLVEPQTLKTQSRAQRLQEKRAMSRYAEKLAGDATKALKAVKGLSLPRNEQREATRTLSALVQRFEKLAGHDLGR